MFFVRAKVTLIRQLLVRKQAHISFARTKIILVRAIFDEIHGVRSNFLHGLPVELRTAGYIAVCQTLSSPRSG